MHVDYSGPMAGVYDRGRRLPEASIRTWVESVAGYLPAGPQPVLDLGAGTGRFLRPLAEGLGAAMVGLEPAAGMRGHAAAKPGRAEVALVAGRAEALPFARGSFRAVWASQVIHHVFDLGAGARELRRVLVDGGRLLVRGLYEDVPTRWLLAPYFPEAVTICLARFPTIGAIREALTSGGFVEIAHQRIEQVVAETPGDFYQRTALRADSALALLSDSEFQAGLTRLRREVDVGTLSGPVTESLDLLVFH
ncbi:MAG TPA: class I SAM-dependent methyltransferase [Acidimicrobiales bacterium]|jgi:ubiquinone/menaquinone biosynthesis C-methylase UbiE|nr:class I SAM-dependent methyltransferase [Acidimicrobiales bacterium]